MLAAHSGKNGYGHSFAKPGHIEVHPQFELLKTRLAAARKPSLGLTVDLFSRAPWLFDQGPTSSCEGHAWSKAISYACPWLTFKPSPKGIYDVGRRIGLGDASLPMEDSGSFTAYVEQGVREWGIRAMGPLPTDGRFSDCDPATINVDPNFDELEDDASTLILGSYTLTNPSTLVADTKHCLDNDVPVATAVTVDSAFETWDPSGPPIGSPTDDQGGHIVCVSGYEVLPTGETVFLFDNSWGVTDWGLRGRGRASEAWLLASQERYAVQARIVSKKGTE